MTSGRLTGPGLGAAAGVEERGIGAPWQRLLQTLDQIFFSILQVDLTADRACVLQSVDYPEYVGREYDWAEYLSGYKRFISSKELDRFASQRLLEQYQNGQRYASCDLPYKTGCSYEWLTITAYLEEAEGRPSATVMVRKSSNEHLQKSIIDLYVYNSCDYFIYLDVRHNSYTSFSVSNSGTPLPAAVSADYSTEMVKYANDFVAPEDRERVIYEMGLKRVQERLEEVEIHSFTCGVIDPVRGYTRKRLEYRYYERKTQMILLSRIDITDVYLELTGKERELQAALTRAHTDSLTGLLNQQGIADEISGFLETSTEQNGLLFIDLDNFKGVNDRFGHEAGNELLRKVADTLRAGLRADDLVGRFGGDEFLVCCKNVRSAEDLLSCAQRLCDGIHRLSSEGNKVSCSVGIAISPRDGTDYMTLMKTADQRAYTAKFSGKNRVFIG